MADGVLAWAKRQHKIWERGIGLLESRKKTTFDVRNGKRVDTTSETLADRHKRLAEVEALIQRHGDRPCFIQTLPDRQKSFSKRYSMTR
jgi:hypothetical protein